ncbi:MAG TPA: hypothetical protein VIG79_09490 [Lapillicoccus sp.]|uniref:hypothetical protein n=1 Tax=Lapillicoccus sp. TaxID=1909287 RepID=UPI002F926F29
MDPQHPTDPRPETASDTGADAYPQVVASESDVDIDAAGDPVQSAVRTLLRNEPDPGPMPADLSRRIEMSLAQAAVGRAGDDELFDELGFSDPDAVHSVEEADDVIVFTGEPDDGHGDDNVVTLRRRRWPLIGAAAAIVALLAIAGGFVAQQRSSNNGLAAIPPAGSTAGSAGSVHVQISNTAYTKDGLVTQAQALIASPGPDASVGDAPSAGPLVTQSGAAACVDALGASDAGAVSIDLATYDGQPAAIVVVRRSDTTSVYAVQRDCGDGDAGVIQDAVPVP